MLFGLRPRVALTLGFFVVAYGAGEYVLRDHQRAVHVWANVGWTAISLIAAIKAPCRVAERIAPAGPPAGAFICTGTKLEQASFVSSIVRRTADLPGFD